ncbi:MICOS complex subunit Mic60 isoform X2 [Microplitis mediator]|uniref:MICOS complex subunit Mic60 isoform X2 n=1 Tax=Microplitis mediator TaxID=375433 RepID=UPI002553F578|nr:MICOS complex subunit Mic60 isoform X2 [Microplitis mediator]
MYRIGLKSSNNFIYQIYKIEKFDTSKLYSTVKCKTLQNCANNGNKLSNRLIVRYSSQNTQSNKSGKSRIGVLAISSVTLGTFAILAYAKNNTDFRNFLEKWIPGTDKTIKLIFFEENSFIANIQDFFSNLKQTLTFGIFNTASETENTKVKDEKKGNDNSRSSPKTINESKTTNLEDFKKSCSQLAAKAISDYENAIQVIHNYNKNVVEIIDANASAVRSSSIWERLREETEKKRKITQQVDKNAADVIQEIKKFLSLVNSKFDVPEGLKSDARKFADNILNEIEKRKKQFEEEQSTVKIAEKYWDKIKTARENFHEELQILFPDINVSDGLFPINDKAFDLFVLYMYNKVNHLESELSKLETIGNEKLKAALRSTGEGASESKIDEVVSREIEKEKRILQEEFAKKLLEERKVFMEELRKQLKLQAQVNADQMKETLDLKEKETQRLINHTLEEQLENESSNYKAQLGVIVGRLRGLDEALKLRLSEEKGACEVQVLWAACQSLVRAVKATPHSILGDQPLRPLELEIKAVLKVAPKEDTLVQATLAAIPEEAVKRGVFPENALRERFLKVEHMARRLALVPEEGASLPIYFLSYLQNFLLVKAETPITKKELSDEPIDVNKLDTYDILNRARYWLDRGNFKMSLKYMNLLSGAPRSVAKDWMNETRILLETQQAVDTLIAYTGAIGLLFLGSDNQKKVEH